MMWEKTIWESNAQNMVHEFHETFGLVINEYPTLPSKEVLNLRVSLIDEEAEEFKLAAADGNMVEMADALGDLLYVVYGAAISLGIDLEPVLEEIHRSNMSKAHLDGSVSRRDDGKVIKAPTYSPACVLDELKKQGWVDPSWNDGEIPASVEERS